MKKIEELDEIVRERIEDEAIAIENVLERIDEALTTMSIAGLNMQTAAEVLRGCMKQTREEMLEHVRIILRKEIQKAKEEIAEASGTGLPTFLVVLIMGVSVFNAFLLFAMKSSSDETLGLLIRLLNGQ